MLIARGRGNARTVVIDIPCAAIVNAASKDQQKEALHFLCDLLGVKEKDAKSEAVSA